MGFIVPCHSNSSVLYWCFKMKIYGLFFSFIQESEKREDNGVKNHDKLLRMPLICSILTMVKLHLFNLSYFKYIQIVSSR